MPITTLPAQPFSLFYGDPPANSPTLYAYPGGLVVAGRTGYDSAAYKSVSAAGGTVLIYLDPIVINNYGRYHSLLFDSSIYGGAVPNWPGNPQVSVGGLYLADFRPTSILQWKIGRVLEQMVIENPHIGGFFLDDLGSRAWFGGFTWASWSTTDQQSYRDGAIAIAQAARTVANRHNLIVIANGTWQAGSLASAGGGYPDLATHGCTLLDGGFVEHHDGEIAFFGPYALGAQWAQRSTATNGHPVMIANVLTSPGLTEYTSSGDYAYVALQASSQYNDGVTPWGSFHATGLPSSASSIGSSLFTSGKLEIAWDGVTWTDVSAYLDSAPVTIRYGRPTEFDDVSPGVMTVTVRNDDGRFMPGNTASPYYPHIIDDVPQIRYTVSRGSSSWVRFWGYIHAYKPSFPTSSTVGAIVELSCTDNMSVLARFPMMSVWNIEAMHASALAGARWDGFDVVGDGGATSWFNNATTSAGTPATCAVVLRPSLAGELSYGGADGLSMLGSISITPSQNHESAVVRVNTPNAIRGAQFWVRFPNMLQTDPRTILDVLTMTTSGSGVVASLKIYLNVTEDDLGLYNSAGTGLGPLAVACGENRWVRVSLLTKTADPTHTLLYYDGGTPGGIDAAFDLRTVANLWFGGTGAAAAQMEVAGILLLGSETAAVPTALGQSATVGGQNVGSRLTGMDYILPAQGYVHASTGGVYTQTAVTGNWHQRDALDVAQEIMRTGSGTIFSLPWNDYVYGLPSNQMYPSSPVVTVDCEQDLAAPPVLAMGSESEPSRVTIQYPAGSVTVVDTAYEATLGGQAQPVTISTLNPDSTSATAVGNTLMSRVRRGLRISQLELDLETAMSDLCTPLFDTTAPFGGLYPTQRIRVIVPSSHFGVSSLDVHVQGWTEIYDPMTGSRIVCDCTPGT